MMCLDLSRGRLPARWLFVRVFAVLALVAINGNSFAGQVSAAWDAVANATGYRLYYGTSSGNYSSSIDATNQTTVTVSGLTDGARYYFAVKAYNSTSTSNFSAEASAVVVAAPVPGFTPPPPTTGSGGGTTSGTGSGGTATPIAPHTKNLVAAYGFEEMSGGQVIDASGNANNGTVSGATRIATNFFGGALKFDGNDDWVTVNATSLLNITGAITMEAWVFPTVNTGVRDILIKEGTNVDIYNLYARNRNGQPESNLFVGGSNRWAQGTAALAVNVWTHVAGTYDGTTLRLFINGVQTASVAVSGPIATSTGPLRIGGNSLWGEFFQGYIDEVRVYNRALTQDEILADSKTAVVGLVLSKSPDRSNAVPLNGLAVSGPIYVYYQHISPTAASNPVKQVAFWLDNPNPAYPSGAPSRIEQKNPYDFAGTADSGGAIGFDTSGLIKGIHTITAQVTLSDGSVLPFINGTFTVQDAGQ